MTSPYLISAHLRDLSQYWVRYIIKIIKTETSTQQQQQQQNVNILEIQRRYTTILTSGRKLMLVVCYLIKLEFNVYIFILL